MNGDFPHRVNTLSNTRPLRLMNIDSTSSPTPVLAGDFLSCVMITTSRFVLLGSRAPALWFSKRPTLGTIIVRKYCQVSFTPIFTFIGKTVYSRWIFLYFNILPGNSAHVILFQEKSTTYVVYSGEILWHKQFWLESQLCLQL